MKTRHCASIFLIILSVLIFSACQKATPQPTQSPVQPGATPTQAAVQPTAVPTSAETGAGNEVLAARDAALTYLSEHYSQDAPASGLGWSEERATPEGLVGSETYRYAGGDWIITVSYPVVAPEAVVYQVVVVNPATAFQWHGEVNATGDVTEFSTAAADPVLAARTATLAYLGEHYSANTPASGMTWTRTAMTPKGLVGAEAYQYRSGYWVVTISYPVVAPDMVVYSVVASNESTGFQWQGDIDASGKVVETTALISGQPVVGWYGLVGSGFAGEQFDAYLALEPEGTGKVGLTGTAPSIDIEIDGLRDSDTHAHFWGTLVCDESEQNGCQIAVTRLRQDAPGSLFDSDPVERWEGTIASTPEGAQFDDYFVLAGDFAVRYGIDSTDPALSAQLESLRDSEATVRLWGRLTCGIPDLNGSQIGVIAIEVVGGPQPPTPMSVDGWVGTIVKLAAGAEYDDYFEREDGERFGIDSTDEDTQKRIAALRTTGSRVRIWGHLLIDVPDVENKQIQLERYKLESRSQAVEGWVGTIIALEAGAQHDDYFERDDGQHYGIETPDPKLAKRLEMLREAGATVRVWGELLSDVLDVEGRQIRVVEIEEVE